MPTYLCPNCDGKLIMDQDQMEGDGGRLEGYVATNHPIICGTCHHSRPASEWKDAKGRKLGSAKHRADPDAMPTHESTVREIAAPQDPDDTSPQAPTGGTEPRTVRPPEKPPAKRETRTGPTLAEDSDDPESASVRVSDPNDMARFGPLRPPHADVTAQPPPAMGSPSTSEPEAQRSHRPEPKPSAQRSPQKAEDSHHGEKATGKDHDKGRKADK